MGSTRSYQDVIWGDSAQIARDMVAQLIDGHEKRVISTARHREKAVKKSQGNFGEVLKFVAEQKDKQ